MPPAPLLRVVAVAALMAPYPKRVLTISSGYPTPPLRGCRGGGDDGNGGGGGRDYDLAFAFSRVTAFLLVGGFIN